MGSSFKIFLRSQLLFMSSQRVRWSFPGQMKQKKVFLELRRR
uniref:Uncharacterized protein n=1 Tax=Lepeophtheirus salmonis TaxID=72036 RepID=A0A0K2V6R8_LEPSM